MNLSDFIFYGLLLFLFLLWIRWRKAKLSLFKKYGIPGPKPHFIYGNILELKKKGLFRTQKEWIEKYGKVVGYYHGLKPVLLVADPELLRKIFIKDFYNFSARPEAVPLRIHTILDYIIPASKIMDTLLPNLNGEKWKSVRRILTHTFTANKLKMMIPAVNKLVDVSVSILEENYKNVLNIHEHLQRLTLDIICAQAFAMDVNIMKTPTHSFLDSAKIIFDLEYFSWILTFGRCFPELGVFAMALNFLKMFLWNKGRIPPLEITKVLEVIIKERRKNPDMRKPDLLQLLMDASVTHEEVEKTNGKPYSGNTRSQRKLTLSDLEIKSNALVVFLAGFETTSSALGFVFHFLALYPDIQRKIQKEIDHIMQKEDELNYYNVNNLQIIERFLLETMRFYPPAGMFAVRISCAEMDYGSIRIPKGIEISVPVNYIHQSDEFWHEPELFDPDRFLLENATLNHSVKYWAFGVGPRNCIGTRLVHLTTKMILAKILHKFNILPAEHSIQKEIPYKVKIGTIEPLAVPIKLELRSEQKTLIE